MNQWDSIVIDELNKKHKGDIEAKEVIFTCAIGRKVKNKHPYSFNCLVLDKSGAGKDNLVGSILKIFPRDDYEIYSRISSKSLNYLHSLDVEPNYSYDGKIIYLKEITEEILNNEVMKEFTSGDEEISQVAITKQKGLGVDIKQVRGHPCVFTTTATTIPTEEIRNRFNILKLDLSDKQTMRTFVQEREDYNKEVKDFLKNLEPYEVDIPKNLFNFIVKVFPKNKVRYRRDFQRLLDFIKAVTIFNQDDRIGKGTGVLISEPEDYNKAKDIFINAYSTCSDIPLKDIDERIIKVFEKFDMPMSAKKITDELGGIITIQNLYPHLRNLVAKEILNELTDRVGGYVITNYVLSVEFKDKKPFSLPNYLEDTNDINTIIDINDYNDIIKKDVIKEVDSSEK
jgi:hypothetical protein